jgi:hypothetical protein
MNSSFPPDPQLPPPSTGWTQKVSALLFCVFCLELGFFLLLYPWSELWSSNYFVGLSPRIYKWLVTPQARGAVSGLGILNLFIAFHEIFRLRRFVRRSQD